MEYHTQHIVYTSREDTFCLYPVGDIHAGTRQCDEPALDALLAEIADNPLALWIGLGDWGDYINLQDPRADIYNLAPWLLDAISHPTTRKERTAANITIASLQTDWLTRKFTPIAPKGIGLITGNHEDAVRRHYDQETTHAMARALSLPCLGYSAYIRLHFDRANNKQISTWTIRVEHGYFASRLAGGRALNLERLLHRHTEADLIICGHGHKRDVQECLTDRLLTTKGQLTSQPRHRFAIMTGSFKDPRGKPGDQPTYEEIKGFDPTPRGTVLATYQPDKHKQHIIL